MAFLGTGILGYVSLLLNDKVVKQNDKLIDMQHNQEKAFLFFLKKSNLSYMQKARLNNNNYVTIE